MPRFIPPSVDWRDYRWGERAVWEALAAQLPPEVTVFYSQYVPDGHAERELDFVVAWPGVGLGVLEVKGGQVQRDEGGQWWSIRSGHERKAEDPLEQVRTARHVLHRYLQDKHQAAASARTQHLVVLPHTEVPLDYDPPDLPRAQLVDKSQLPELAERLKQAIEQGQGFATLEPAAVQDLVDLFAPPLPAPAEALLDLALQDEQAQQVASEYAERLDMLSLQTRFTVVGGAGTGKTVMATEQARRLAKEGKRVALLCYSRGLGRFLEQEAAGWRHPPAYVGLFHDLALSWGAPGLTGDASTYYEEVLPRALGELAKGRADLFDAVVVDEAQDFGEHWWPSLLQCLKDPDAGGVYVFMDEDQRVFHRAGAVPVGGQPLVLRRNFRNTKRIAQVFGSLSSDGLRAGGREGPRVRFVQSPAADALDLADDCVEALLDVWEPHQVALLTTHHRHPVQKEYPDQQAYWSSYFDGEECFYGTVGGFKGLERPAVVLAVNGFNEQARAKEMLYVGLSRARSQLVVVGDLEEIAGVGGEGVRKRLEAAEAWAP